MKKPYDPAEPVVCLDEKPVSYMPTSALPLPPNRDAKHGATTSTNAVVQPMFCAIEPKAGRHFTFATPNRSAFEFRASGL